MMHIWLFFVSIVFYVVKIVFGFFANLSHFGIAAPDKQPLRPFLPLLSYIRDSFFCCEIYNKKYIYLIGRFAFMQAGFRTILYLR